MDWINVSLTSLSMSIDAMTVSAVDGMREGKMRMWKLLLISFTFGIMQMAMPMIGYSIGYSFQEQLESYIPWVAFVLLTLLSLKSLYEFIKEIKNRGKEEEEEEHNKEVKIPEILFQGVATSIDALCIGFVYLDLPLSDAFLVFGIIGITCTVLSFLTGLFGNKLAGKLEKWSGLISAVVFFAVGLKILLEGVL